MVYQYRRLGIILWFTGRQKCCISIRCQANTFSYLYDWNCRCISCNSKDVKCSSIVFIYYYSLPRSFHGTLYKHVFLGKTMNGAEMSSQ